MRAVSLAVAVPLVLTACMAKSGTTASVKTSPVAHSLGSPSGSASSPGSSPSPSVPAASSVKLTISPGPDSRAVKPTQRVEVRATGGHVEDVQLKAPDGHLLRGSVGADGVWRSAAGTLPFATTFTVTAQGIDASGLSKSVSSRFTTVKPGARLYTSISPLGDTVVGVGMPIIVRFNAPVTEKAAVESHLTVTTSRPVVGAWSWISDTEVHWRPKTYWPANTGVKLAVRLTGVHAGKNLWGDDNHDLTFRVGDAMISTVDVTGHKMTITRNGVVLKTVPVTTGKAGFVTRSGIKLILEKTPSLIMDAATINIPKNSPNYYRLRVYWALRVTWSGEFVHAAPWSQSEQGLANVSHGCTGMSMANAQWFYNLSKVGDVVKYIHSPRPLEPQNGWTDWNVSWANWVKGDALHAA